jgi:vancomycin resistance protein YoaR
MSSISYPSSRSRFSIEQALIAILIGLLIFGASLVAFFIGFQVWYAGRIFPGTQVAGIDVGGLTQQEAARLIAERVTYPQEGKIVLRMGDTLWNASPLQLGLFLDAQTSARNAYQLGRSGFMNERFREQFDTWYYGHDVPPSLVFDQRAAYSFLSNLAQEINLPTVEASLALRGTEVEVLPGQVGRTVDIEKTLLAVSLQVQSMRDGVITLFIEESTPVILDASAQAELARSMLSQPLTISMPEGESDTAGPWTIDPQTLAAMLAFERVEKDNGMQYEVRMDSSQLRQYLLQVAPGLSRTPRNPRFVFNDETRQLEVIQPAVIGRELDVEATVASVHEKLLVGDHTVSLVMKQIDPPVTDQSSGESLGITELVHAETSYFYGSSQSRVQNISTAASKFHGVLVPPGAVFSMAETIGDITLDNGYAEALIIIGGQTIKGVGGGVCQVSTTLFRTAFFAGMPIVERYAHAYRVYYYEKVAGNRLNTRLAGLDATVFVPIVDFKFTNDTPYWLLMETYVNPGSSSITWKFYSTTDGRRVEWDTTGAVNIVKAPAPLYRENSDLRQGEIKQVDWAADGADVTVRRVVYRNDQVYLQDTIYTHYQPWQDVYEYGPGTELPNQNDDE